MRQCSCDEESDAQRNKITWQNIFLDLVPDSAGHSPFSMDNHLSFLWFSPPLLSHPPPHLPSAHSSPVPLSSALRLFLVIPRSVWGLRFPPRDWSRSPGSHGVLSMHHKGIPSLHAFFRVSLTRRSSPTPMPPSTIYPLITAHSLIQAASLSYHPSPRYSQLTSLA